MEVVKVSATKGIELDNSSSESQLASSEDEKKSDGGDKDKYKSDDRSDGSQSKTAEEKRSKIGKKATVELLGEMTFEPVKMPSRQDQTTKSVFVGMTGQSNN